MTEKAYYHIIISFLALVNVKTSHSANLSWTIKNLTTSMPHRAAPVYFYNAMNDICGGDASVIKTVVSE